MSNKMDLFNQTKATPRSKSRLVGMMQETAFQAKPNTVNPDGFAAYKDNKLEREYARVVLANIVKNQFYERAETAAQQARDIHLSMVHADPILHLKGLIKSRDANLKAQTQIGLAVFMSKIPASAWKQRINDGPTIESVLVELTATLAPKQMLATAEMLRNKVFGKGLGSAAKRVFSKAMATWSPKYAEYYAITYRNEINQLLRMIHPPKWYFNEHAYNVLHAAIDGVGPITKRQEIAFEMVSDPENYKVSDQKFGELLIKYDIDWNSTKALKNMQSSRAWLARMMQMSVNALLLNLVSLDRHEVFKYPEAIQYLDQKMDEVGKARILPMEIVRAYKMVTNPQVKALLRKGFASSFNYKVEAWEDKSVAFFLDVSGSMDGDRLSYASSIAASLLPSINQNALTFGIFNTNLHLEDGRSIEGRLSYWGDYGIPCPKITGITPEQLLDVLFRFRAMGGTDTSIGIQYLINNYIHKDVIIMVTDEQQNTGNPMYRMFKQYQSLVNPNAQLFILNPTDYEWHNSFPDDSNVFVINTLTPSIFKAMPEIPKADEIIKQVDIASWTRAQVERRKSFAERDKYTVEYIGR